MALTVQNVHDAADELFEQGITPTQTKIRAHLGGGSFTTIGEALKSWKQEQQEHEQLKRTDMPDALKDEGIVFIAKLWQEADKIANVNLKAEREALTISQTKAQAEIDNAQEAIATLETEQSETINLLKLSDEKAQKATSEVEASTKEITSLNTFITELTHKLNIENERTTSATSLLTATNDKLDSTRLQLDGTNDQLTQARESIATYKATNQAQTNDIERLKADAIEYKQSHQITIDKLKERTAERDDLAKQLALVQGKLEAVNDQNVKLTVERDKLNDDLKSLTVSASVLQSNNEQLSSDNKALSQTITKLQAQIKSLENIKHSPAL